MQHKSRKSPFRFERLEPRLLLSADPVTTGLALLAPDAPQDERNQEILAPYKSDIAFNSSNHDSFELTDVTTIFADAATTHREVVFIDAKVDNYDALINDLGNQIDIVLVDDNRDGIDQINDYLALNQGIDTIHIVSHGNQNGFWLGNTFLNQAEVQARQAEISTWSNSLSDSADILLYGCNLASTESGQLLLNKLAELSGADIAASDDLTGSQALGGDWDLEFSSGTVESTIAFSQALQASWLGTLDAITVTTTNDVLDGDADTSSLSALLTTPGSDGLISLREAIVAANNDAGADTIFLGSGSYIITNLTLDDLGGDFDIRDDLSIVGVSPTTTILDGNLNSSVVDIHDDSAITVTLANLKVQNGITSTLSGSDGAGMQIQGGANLPDVYVSNVWFFNNDANGLGDQGGAIYNAANLTVSNSLFENNTADNGGAIYNTSAATLKVANATFSNNTATAGSGGALNNQGTAGLINITMTLNSATANGGGIHTDGTGSTSIGNAIIAGNNATGGPDINDVVSSNGNNIIGDDSDASGFVASDHLNVDPLLGLLMDNGGELKTHAPSGGSAAINGGNTALAPAVDQNGIVRDASPDIGAHEVGAAKMPDAGTLWFSTDKAVVSGGQNGVDSWDEADVLSFDNPDLNLGPGTTNGSVANVINFAGAAPAFEGMHFVSQDVAIAGGAFQLLAGDVLFNSSSNSAVFNSNNVSPLQAGFSAIVNADRRDIVVFRPDTLGDYSTGQFGFLIDDPDGADFFAFTLIESATNVGGTTLNAGDFLFVRSGGAEDQDIKWFAPTAIGDGTTTGSVTLLLDGDDANVNIAEQIHGLELIENTVTVGGVTLETGQILVSVHATDSVGNNNLAVTANDIFILDVAQSTAAAGAGNGIASASKLFTGFDAGFDTNDERFNSLALNIISTTPVADASAGAPHTIIAGGAAAFDGSNSSDPNGSITTYEWDLDNDGSFEKTGVTTSFNWGELSSAGIDTDGTYDVALRVTDNDGNTASTVFTLTVNNDTPTLSAFAATIDTTNEDTDVEITFAELAAQGNEADISGTVDAFIVRSVLSGTLKIGTDAASASAFAAGSNDVIGSGLNAYWTPATNQNGTLNAFTVEARDDDGAVSGTPVTAQMTVNDINDAPSFGAFTSVIDTTNEDTEVEITLAELLAQGDENDVDGAVDSFVVRAVSSGTLKIGADSASATAFAVGVNDVIGAGLNAYWTPASHQNGTLNAFMTEARDDDGALSGTPVTAQITVASVNDAPTISGGPILLDTIDEDNISNGYNVANILSSFSTNDVDGNALGIAVTNITGKSTWQYSADSTDGLDGTWQNVPNVSNSTALLLAPTAWLRYTPDTISGESVNIQFRAWDLTSGSASATGSPSLVDTTPPGGTSAFSFDQGSAQVIVTDLNDLPTFTAFSAPVDTTNEDTEVEITLAELLAQGDENDVDGTVDSFVVRAVSSGTLKIGADSASAIAFAVGVNDVIGAGLNAYWTPANHQNGTLNAFTVEARDNDGGLSGTPVAAQVSVIDVNDLPTFSAFSAPVDTTNEDTEVEITLAELLAQGDENDVDGTVDSFVVRAVSSGTLKIGADSASATAFAVGVNDVIGAGLHAYWTPANHQNGTLNAFTVEARDNDGGLSGTPVTAQVSVIDVNDLPTFSAFSAPVDTTNEDTEVEITLAELLAQGDENDVDGTVDSFVVRAVSSGTLKIGADSASATAFAVGVNDVIGAGLNAYWTPANHQNGTLNAFTVEARDNDGGLSGTPVQTQITANSMNDAPVIAGTVLSPIATESGSSTGAVALIQGGTASVSDSDAANFNGGHITVSLDHYVAGDLLSIAGSPAGISSTSGGNGSDLVINLNSSATTLAVENILESLRFTHNGDNPTLSGTDSVRNFGILINDGGNSPTNPLNSNTLSGAITLVAENDGPNFTSLSAPIDVANTGIEEQISFVDIHSLSDANDVDGTVDAYVVKNVLNGLLKIGTSAATASAWVAGVNDTIDPTNNAYWTSAPMTSGNINAFELVAKDNGNLESSPPVVAQLTVFATNQAPTVDQNSLQIAEGESKILSIAELSASDLDDPPTAISITASNVQHGQFERINVPGIAVTNFTQADIQAGRNSFRTRRW